MSHIIDPNLVFVLGLLAMVLSTPRLMVAYIDGYWPIFMMSMFVLGGIAMGYIYYQNPQAYGLSQIPIVVFDVIGRYVTR